jgi:glycosyltransferase involved in cell wall biosynthesis
MILVSFFLATMNRKLDLEETIKKIYEQDYKNIEIVIVDNGSVDGTEEMVKKFPSVNYIKLKENIGAIPARNVAMKNCKGEILMSLDDDSFPGKNSIKKIVEIFKDNSIGLITCKILDYYQYINEYKKLSEIKNNNINEDYFWSGCGGAFRKNIVERLGYWEEWGRESPFELTTTAKTIYLNYKCVSNEEVYVFHKWSKLGEPAQFRISDEAFYYGAKSYLKYLFKFSPISFLLFSELIKIIYISTFDLISKRRILITKACLSAFSEFKSIYKERLPLDHKIFRNILPAKNFLGK